MSSAQPPVAEQVTADPEPVDGGATSTGKGAVDRGLEIVSRWAVVLAIFLLIAVFSILEPEAFFSLDNFQIMLGSQAVLVLLALGLTISLTANEFDLSIASVMAFAAVWMAILTVDMGVPLLFALVVVLFSAIAVGAVNALLVVRLGINSFIATLAVGTVLTGITLKISDLTIITGLPEALTTATSEKLLGIQLIFFYAIAVAVVFWYVLEHTPLGRWTMFVGAGRDVARLAGLPVSAIRAGALIVTSVVAALAGVLNAGVQGAADPNLGTAFLLPAFAAAFLGATTIKPGRFNVWGTVCAVYMVIVGIVGLQITTGSTGWIVSVFNGGVLVIALVAARLLGGKAPGSAS